MPAPIRNPTLRLACALMCACASASASASAAESAPLVVPVPDAIPAGTPVIPWVAAGDSAWQRGAPTFTLGDPGSDLKVAGWLAVSDVAILWHVVVNDREHLNGHDGGTLYQGDSLQLAIDALGEGVEQAAAEQSYAVHLNRQGADYGVMLSSADGRVHVHSFYHGRGLAGDKPGVPATVVRDESAKTTTYDIAVPWSDLGAAAGLAPSLRVALQVNDANSDWKQEHRLWWGTGVGGRFLPQFMNRLALGPPPGPVAAAILTQDAFGEHGTPAEIRVAFTGPATIVASAGSATTTQPEAAGSGAGGLSRYAIRLAPCAGFRGSVPFAARLIAGGKELAAASCRVFDDSSAAWYAFTPANATDGVIGMADWLDAPAGKHGFVQAKGDKFAFEDGTPVKFWGVGRHSCIAPQSHKEAAFYAEWYAHLGVNAVLDEILFALGWEGIGDRGDSTKTNPKQLDDLDFLDAELKKRGIYHGFDAFWTENLRPQDRDKVPDFDEVKDHAQQVECFVPEIQDLRIAAIVNYLTHVNPYTGLAAGNDPALSEIDLRNEQDIYWYNVAPMQDCPHVRAQVCRRFCAWLTERYHDEAGLRKAWGDKCFGMWGCDKDESLAAGTLSPLFNAWFFSSDGLVDQDRYLHAKRRLLDAAEFLYDCQRDYYLRFAKAIRATGFKGILYGGNWQAADGVGHIYNLLSDAATGGYICRHNYFGGSGRNEVAACDVQDDSSMLWRPGCALLSSGMQQLAGVPFGMGEWCEEAPMEWTAEAPVILGCYGMGLQGWSALYQSFGNYAGYSPTMGDRGTQVYNAEGPSQACLFPTLVRMVDRGDIKEGAVVAARRFSLQDLRDGTLGFAERVAQSSDVKEITGDAPMEALAAGKVVLEQVGKPQPPLIPDLRAALERKTIDANTGQLSWHYADHGDAYITIDTDGTKGLCGFTPKRPFTLGEVTLSLDTKFAVLLVTALDRHETLANATRVLITAFARERNTGMVYNPVRGVDVLGKAPLIIEPVEGAVAFKRRPTKATLLDHDGRPTARAASLDGCVLTIDGVQDRTMFYEVDFR